MSSLRLRGGRVVDPAADPAAVQRDLGVRDGRIVALSDGEVFDHEIDASGCVVMAGGIDLHTHIGGGKVNLARLLMADDHRDGIDPIAPSGNPLELASCGRCTPGHAGHRLPLCRDGLHRGLRAGHGAEQCARTRTWRWATCRSSTMAPT